MLKYPASYTDYYELTMAQGYYLSGRHEETAIFDYFFRSTPFQSGYVVFVGIADFLELIRNYRFTDKELTYLNSQGFDPSFLDYLKDFQFSGSVSSVKEGEIVFPNEPIVKVKGTILETQLIETLLLNILNFESLIATKASRIRQAAGDSKVLDFGLRRSQGYGGIQASKAAIIGGLDGTSNVYTGLQNGVEVRGTMAHSWIQSFHDELEAFRTYARHYPESCVLLVDTYDTLKSGIPNAVKVAHELEAEGHKLIGIRLDSGDLAYLAKESRKILDDAGLEYVKIAASNQLDEHLIKSLREQRAPIDLYGVGTKLITAYDNPALDGVYKLCSVADKPTLKISENVEKITLPGSKKLIRYFNSDGTFNCDGIIMDDENSPEQIQHPYFPDKQTNVSEFKSVELLEEVISDGEFRITLPTARESAEYAKKRLSLLNTEHKRFDNPHVYKVGISESLASLKKELMNEYN